MSRYYYVVFVQDDWFHTRVFGTRRDAVNYAKSIRPINSEIRKVDEYTNDFMVIPL